MRLSTWISAVMAMAMAPVVWAHPGHGAGGFSAGFVVGSITSTIVLLGFAVRLGLYRQSLRRIEALSWAGAAIATLALGLIFGLL